MAAPAKKPGFDVADLAFKVSAAIPAAISVSHLVQPEKMDDMFWTSRSNKNLHALAATALVMVSGSLALTSKSTDRALKRNTLNLTGGVMLAAAATHLRGIQTKDRKREPAIAMAIAQTAVAGLSFAGANSLK